MSNELRQMTEGQIALMRLEQLLHGVNLAFGSYNPLIMAIAKELQPAPVPAADNITELPLKGAKDGKPESTS